MATTATILLMPAAAVLPDGATNEAAPAIVRNQSSFAAGANAPKVHFLSLDFDPTTDEYCFFGFRMPSDYASAPVLKVQWMANAVANSVIWVCKVGAVSPADADTPIEHVQGADNSATTAVNTTEANRLTETSITLTNADSLAPGDLVLLTVFRDATAAGDTCTVDAKLVAASLEYTTT